MLDPAAMIENITLLQALIGLAVTVFGGLAFLIRKKRESIIKFKREMSAAMDGLRAVPAMRAELDGISRYVGPNGGGSIYEGMMRTEHAVELLAEGVSVITATMRAEDDCDDTAARFDCSEEGGNTHVSLTYSSWMECSRDELLHWNFLNFVHPSDAEAVKTLWDQCRQQHRQYRNTHRMITKSGKVLWFKVTATPVPDGPPARRWIGIMRPVLPPGVERRRNLAGLRAVDEE